MCYFVTLLHDGFGTHKGLISRKLVGVTLSGVVLSTRFSFNTEYW